MANTIKIKNSGTASAVPTSLEYGELGLNYADGKIYFKNSSNVITDYSTVAAAAITIDLDDLVDVTITTPASGQILEYNGSSWVNRNTVRDNMIKFYMEVL
jgi:hypothetical protein